jgi:AraC-like DNA-binding protein
MKLAIKNMVCSRCIMAVTAIFEQHQLKPTSVSLGEVNLIQNEISTDNLQLLNTDLLKIGFEIIEDKKRRIIEKIKNTIIEHVHHFDDNIKLNLSHLLSQKLNYDYNYLSNLFSEVENTTIEKYFIIQKIERVKELLVYDELSISQIADRLDYSSGAYLSSQFKKITGFTPTFYKTLKENKRIKIEEL